jgi:predicted Holliday junction resolvase-like endonuclease
MVYVFAVLSALLFLTLTVTQVRAHRLRTILVTSRDDATAHAQEAREAQLRAEAQVRDLSARVADLIELDSVRKLQVQAARKDGEAHGRKDALKRAQAVAHGFSGENFAPLLDNRWDHKDFRHMGDPVDYLVFVDMDKVRNSKAGPALQEVVLLDIKTGGSQLSTIQRRIRDAVSDGRVRFAIYNTDTGELRAWPPYEEPEDRQLKLFS